MRSSPMNYTQKLSTILVRSKKGIRDVGIDKFGVVNLSSTNRSRLHLWPFKTYFCMAILVWRATNYSVSLWGDEDGARPRGLSKKILMIFI
jgi:hypothetical protein